MNLQVAGFLDHSTVNGIGFRSVLFVSGCCHSCSGCHNKAMQDFDYGEPLSIHEIFKRILKNKPLIDGVTFSGGEPFKQCEALSTLAQLIKEQNLNIWCYSGYTYEELISNPHKRILLDYVDVLVDGPFIQSLANSNLKYRGSSNQHVYQLENGKIIQVLDDLVDSI